MGLESQSLMKRIEKDGILKIKEKQSEDIIRINNIIQVQKIDLPSIHVHIFLKINLHYTLNKMCHIN